MIPTETRERFIRDLDRQLGGAEIMEAHFFAPRRVGGVESAIAVLAATQPVIPVAIEPAPEGAEAAPDAGPAAPLDLATLADESPYAPDSDAPLRYTVFTASYRHTLKGPERGRWEVLVKAEADAPLVTVDQVVRGVQRRAEDTDEVDRMSGDEVRAILELHQLAAG